MGRAPGHTVSEERVEDAEDDRDSDRADVREVDPVRAGKGQEGSSGELQWWEAHIRVLFAEKGPLDRSFLQNKRVQMIFYS